MISHVDIIGALVYRTRQALNRVEDGKEYSTFYENAMKHYKYAQALFDAKNVMHLWHFAGTQNEIQDAFDVIGKDEKAVYKLFPCIINFQSVVETHGVGADGLTQFDFDLAICTLVDSKWSTEQRNRTAHKYVLEPIYDAFMHQLRTCGWFQIPLQGLDFSRMKVFTTGNSMHKALRTQYGWYMDSIEMVDLRPLLKPNLCDADYETIEREAELVTDSILLKRN